MWPMLTAPLPTDKMHAILINSLLTPPEEVYNFETFEGEDASVISPEMETSYCSNFVCCGVNLPDFHELLKHFEESHIRFEEEDGPKPALGGIRISLDSPQVVSPPSKVADGNFKRKRHISLDMEPYQGPDHLSAFDNAVLRRSSSSSAPKDLKRPSTKRLAMLKNALGLYNESSMTKTMTDEEQTSLIYSILSAASNTEQTTTEYETCTFGQEDPIEVEIDEEDCINEKPYACRVAGCCKRYKNPNGLKYHMMNGHCGKGGRVDEKPYKCPVSGCGKRYKNPNGLKYHLTTSHVNLDSVSIN